MKLGRSHWNSANPDARRYGHLPSFRSCWNPSWRINYIHKHIDLSAQLLQHQTTHHDESLFAHRPTNPVLQAVRLVTNDALTGSFYRCRENSLTFTSPESVRLPVRLPPNQQATLSERIRDPDILPVFTFPTRNRPTHHRQGPRLDPDPDR